MDDLNDNCFGNTAAKPRMCARAGWRTLLISSEVKPVVFTGYFLNGVRRPILCQKFLRLGSASTMTCWGNADGF